MKELQVVAGILVNNDEILCMKRGKGKYEYVSFKYEFPGGKIEAGETPAQALRRELTEELLVNIKVYDENFYMTVEHEYPDFKIILHTFLCPVASRKFTLTEHIDFKWLPKSQLKTIEWAEADLPVVEKLII